MPELIRGNQDGPRGGNDTYTICRVDVDRQRLVEEIRRGLHPSYEVAMVGGEEWPKPLNGPPLNDSLGWLCPATRASRHATADPAEVPTPPWNGKTTECIRLQDLPAQTFTICRLGVPRQKLVAEVRCGDHPGYKVTPRHETKLVKISGSAVTMEVKASEDFVSGKADGDPVTNVNQTRWQCHAVTRSR